MTEPIDLAECDDVVEYAAAEWVVRLQQSDLSRDEVFAWQRWMRNEEHAAAFTRLEGHWQKFDSVAPPTSPSTRALAEDTYDGSRPIGAWLREKRARRNTLTLRYAAAACALLSVAAFIGVVLRPRSAARDELAHQMIETAVGENRSVTLADGSTVKLGGHTRLTFSLRAHVRDLNLESGEAYFAVAKDASKPFQVHAGNATVTAVGTQFDVHKSDDRITVSVLEGRVTVQPMAAVMPMPWLPASRPVGRAASLTAGERTTVNAHGVEPTSVADRTSTLEWQDGRLAFEGESMRYVIEDVNRYARTPIVIADRRIANLKVTGTIANDNILGWVMSLKSAFGVRAEIQADRIVLHKE